jgi:hypothetical protein
MIDRLQRVLDNFIKKNLNISGSRIQKHVTAGGLGMFNLKKFLGAQQCTWIARAFRNPIDNWQYDLKRLSPMNNIALIRPCDVPVDANPILHNFTVNFKSFYGAYSRCYNNFRHAYIFDNPAITWGENFTLNKNFFGRDFYDIHKDSLRSLIFNNCFNNDNSFRTREEFEAIGLPLTPAVWMRLRACLLQTRNLLTTASNVNLGKPIEDFLNIPTRGSKRFRIFYDRNEIAAVKLNDLRNVITFYGLIDLPVPVRKILSPCLKLWTHSFIGNDLREFSFKCRNNYLSLNNRRAAYDPDVNPACTFCRIRDPDTETRESFKHIFFTCPVSSQFVNVIVRDCFPLPRLTVAQVCEFFWNGYLDGKDDIQFLLNFFWETFRYVVYRYKLRRKIPNVVMIKNEIFFIIKTTLYCKDSYIRTMENDPTLARWVQAIG